MKNLSNIKSALAVSMLLSASLFSMQANCGCPSKLTEEMLSEKASASAFRTGGKGSLAPEYQTNESSKSRTYLDGREKGIIVIGGRSIIIETGEEKIVVQGGLHRAVYENENAARSLAEIQGREDHFKAVIAQYDLVRQRENFSGKQCLNAVIDSHIRADVLVSDDKVKGLLAESDNSEIKHLIGVRYVEGQKALWSAQNEEAKELAKETKGQKSKLSHFVANTSENEEINKFAGVSFAAIGKPKETDCGGFKVQYMRSGSSRPQYKKLFEAIKSSTDQNAVAYLDHVTRIEALEAQSAELALRMSQTKDRIEAAEKSNGELKDVAKAAKKSFVESLRTTTDERLYALKGIKNNIERVDNDGARFHRLSEEELTQRRNAVRAELQFHVRDVKHVGVESTVENRFAASTRKFRQETFFKNDALTDYMRHSDDRNLRQAFSVYDLARLQAKGKSAVRELDYRIHELQSDLEAHEASDRLVHAAMVKKAPAPKGWFASAVCYLTK